MSNEQIYNFKLTAEQNEKLNTAVTMLHEVYTTLGKNFFEYEDYNDEKGEFIAELGARIIQLKKLTRGLKK
jgi:hypothetical protein